MTLYVYKPIVHRQGKIVRWVRCKFSHGASVSLNPDLINAVYLSTDLVPSKRGSRRISAIVRYSSSIPFGLTSSKNSGP